MRKPLARMTVGLLGFAYLLMAFELMDWFLVFASFFGLGVVSVLGAILGSARGLVPNGRVAVCLELAVFCWVDWAARLDEGVFR